MRKQLLYSVIGLLSLGVALLGNAAVMYLNPCLSEGFILEDSKVAISALLYLPVYYHAISEVIITIYCFYINTKNSNCYKKNTIHVSSELNKLKSLINQSNLI